MSEGKRQADDYNNCKHLLHHIFVLLDYLERQSDNRLQAQFDDTREKLKINSPKVAIAPCDKYDEFFCPTCPAPKKAGHHFKCRGGAVSAFEQRFSRCGRASRHRGDDLHYTRIYKE